MKENVMLLQEINVLRKDVHELRQKIRLIGIMGGGGENGSTQRSQIQQNMDMSMRSAEKDHIQKELKL
jgi:hypothetical protein